jgi:hypothetical protein
MIFQPSNPIVDWTHMELLDFSGVAAIGMDVWIAFGRGKRHVVRHHLPTLLSKYSSAKQFPEFGRDAGILLDDMDAREVELVVDSEEMMREVQREIQNPFSREQAAAFRVVLRLEA